MLRVRAIQKTKLKSNHYWVMVLVTRLANLRCLKFHSDWTFKLGPDFYKFLAKGFNYGVQNEENVGGIKLEKYR